MRTTQKLVNWNISKTSKVHNVCLSSCLHFVLSPVCYYQINLLPPVFPSTLIITALSTLKNNSINISLIRFLHLLCHDSNCILQGTQFDAFSSTLKQLWSSFISANNHYTYQDWQKRQSPWHTFTSRFVPCSYFVIELMLRFSRRYDAKACHFLCLLC